MKRAVSAGAVLVALALTWGVAAAVVPAKGTEGPDTRLVSARIEPKGIEGPDIRATVEPRGVEGPDVR